MPQYKKVFDIGTYTGNGGQYRVGIPTLRGVGPSGKQAAGSLRFRSAGGNDSKLSRTFAAGNQYKWTWSCWMKFGPQPNSTMIFNYNSGGGYSRSYNEFTNYQLDFGDYSAGGSYIWHVQTTAVFKDPSIWYHFVVIYDSAQATASNRVIMYCNGSRITNYSTASYPSQNYAGYVNQAGSHVIGSIGYQTGYSYDGYMSEMYFLDGYAYDSSYFGEYNSDNIWVPKAYSGSYGTNGFYLPMNSSSNYATDQSGNGNNWTPNNMNVTTANTTYDLFSDSPTDYLSGSMTTANNAGNYATMNPNNYNSGGSGTYTNGNLTFSIPNAGGGYATFSVTSGKWYWEAQSVSNPIAYGVRQDGSTDRYTSSIIYDSSGNKLINGSSTAYGASWTTTDVIGVALDCDGGTVTFYKNNTSQGSINLSTASITKPIPMITAGGGAAHTGNINFGQRPFTYTPPSGHVALNTYNITRPADSSLWFYGDTPDLMWIKNRSTTGLNTITDTVRGMGLNLVTSSTAAETSYPGVTEMNKFGMTVINDATSILNGSTNSHVYWGWKANTGTTVTNTDGFDTSQVSVNRQTGFSIITYTGTGTNMSIGHGLGAAPNLIIIKSRNNTQNWTVYHSSVGTAKYLNLNSTATPTSAADYFTGITSTLWSMTGSATTMATNGTTYVAYCWTAIPGYSAFGSYSGNGSTDGVFIYTGFRPRFLLIKRTSTTDSWYIHDTSRSTYNVSAARLLLDSTAAEVSDQAIDFVSNGFKFRTTDGAINGSGSTYIYAAFAEVPFKVARAR